MAEERMIGGPLKRAIEDLGNYGVKANIIRLRALEADRRKLALCLQEVQALRGLCPEKKGRVWYIPTCPHRPD